MSGKRYRKNVSPQQRKTNRRVLLWCMNPEVAFKNQAAFFKVDVPSDDITWRKKLKTQTSQVGRKRKLAKEVDIEQMKRLKDCFGEAKLLPHRFRIVYASPKKLVAITPSCPYCHRQVQDKHQHISTSHPYRCHLCKLDFKEKLEQMIHGIYEHQKEQHMCLVCKKVFSGKHYFDLHCKGQMHKAMLDVQWRTLEDLLQNTFHLSIPPRNDLSDPDVISTLRLVLSKPGVVQVRHESPVIRQMLEILFSAVNTHPTDSNNKLPMPAVEETPCTNRMDTLEIMDSLCARDSTNYPDEKKSVAVVHPMQVESMSAQKQISLQPQIEAHHHVLESGREDSKMVSNGSEQVLRCRSPSAEWSHEELYKGLTPVLGTPSQTSGTMQTPVFSVLNSPFRVHSGTRAPQELMASARRNAFLYNWNSGITSDPYFKEFEELWQNPS